MENGVWYVSTRKSFHGAIQCVCKRLRTLVDKQYAESPPPSFPPPLSHPCAFFSEEESNGEKVLYLCLEKLLDVDDPSGNDWVGVLHGEEQIAVDYAEGEQVCVGVWMFFALPWGDDTGEQMSSISVEFQQGSHWTVIHRIQRIYIYIYVYISMH